MNDLVVGPVPAGYKKAVSEELRGPIKECSYLSKLHQRSRQL